MRVPLLDLSRQYASIREEVLAAIDQVCDSQQYIFGPEVSAFEREFGALCGAREVVGCGSGTDALWLALMAIGVRPGDEVITTPFSFFATASCILRAGARPVFVDIDPETLNISPQSIEQKFRHSARRRPILAVHLYGQCADMDAINALGAEHRSPVIEDAAQAVGAAWKDKAAGSLASAAAFSFYPSKNLSAFGDAGAVTANDPQVAEHARLLGNHGSRRRYYHDEIGANSRLDSLQAAVLRVKMRHLPQWNAARRQRARFYDSLLQASGLTRSGTDSPAPVTPLKARTEAHHIYHQYVIRAHNRDKLREFLKERDIGTEVYYPVPLHLQKCFTYLGYALGDLPQAEQAASEVLALPMFPELAEEEQHYVVECMAEFYS